MFPHNDKTLSGYTLTDTDKGELLSTQLACGKARAQIYGGISELLRLAQSPVEDVKRSVWAARRIVPDYRTMVTRIANDACLIERTMGEHTLRYSISIRVGEVRIGVIIPVTMQSDSITFSDVSLSMRNLLAFPDKSVSAKSPVCMSRYLDNVGYLVDYVYDSIRFADLTLTVRALAGDKQAISVVTDGIFHDLIHISNAVSSALSVLGFMVEQDTINAYADYENSAFYSRLPIQQLIDLLIIEPNRINQYGNENGLFKYVVLIPKNGSERDAILRKLDAITAEEESIRQAMPAPK